MNLKYKCVRTVCPITVSPITKRFLHESHCEGYLPLPIYIYVSYALRRKATQIR